MKRLLISAAIHLIGAALAIWVSSLLVDGLTLRLSGFIAGVVIFVLILALVTPLTNRLAQRYAAAFEGGTGILATLIALWVATLIPGGLRIDGLSAWVVTPILVWLLGALGSIALTRLLLGPVESHEGESKRKRG